MKARIYMGGIALVGLLVAAAPPDALQLPQGRTAVPVTNPYTRVTVRADSTVEHEGKLAPRVADSVVVPALAGPLKAFFAQHGDGSVLVAGDRRADFRAVREVLASTAAAGGLRADFLVEDVVPPRAIRIEQSFGKGDPWLLEAPEVPPLPPLTVHVASDRLWLGRDVATGVRLPRVDGALDLEGLTALLDEDRRLHAGNDMVVINTDDGVPYGEMVVVFDLTREKGYPYTLLAGGPAPSPLEPAPPPPPVATGPVEAPPEVTVHRDGALDVRGADGSLEPIRAEAVTAYDAHCDATTCDLVVNAKGRRILVAARPRAVPVPGWLFAKPVHAREGRLGLATPRLTGTLSPIVGYPWAPPARPRPAAATAPPIVLGSLDKALIDDVIKENMGRVRACYQDLLARDRVATGKVTVKFVIQADGTVQRAVIKASAIADEAFQSCLTETLATFAFPKPKGNGIVVVVYPFVFSPG